MSATACTLAAVLMLEAVSPLTEKCPDTDNRCKAGLYERRASVVTDPGDRALYLFGAYRLYMILFEKTADRGDLCAARRAIDASLAVRGQSAGQREISRTKRAELMAAQADTDCPARTKKKAKPPPELMARPLAQLVLEPPAGPPPPLEPLVPDPPADPQAPAQQGPPATIESLVDLGSSRSTPHSEPDTELMPVAPRPMHNDRPANAPRPGRGLVIAGGVTLGVGVAIAATAGFMGSRMADTRRDIIDLSDSVDGYATADQNARDDALRHDYRTTQTWTRALALGAGATVLVAVVLTAIGGRRMARVASRTSLAPAPGGLVFYARF